MLFPRIASLVLAVALIDAAAASFAALPGIRWVAVAIAVLYALLASFAFRSYPTISASTGLLALAGLFALGEFVAGPNAGLAMTGVPPGTALAIMLAAALLLCGIGAAFFARAPVGLRAAGAVIAIAAAIPFVLAASDGTLGTAYSGVFGWFGWAGVSVVLPIAVICGFVFAGFDIARKRWSHAAAGAITALALLACVQAGSHAAGTFGMPSVTSFEGYRSTV
jgi:hypothetical protein